MKRKFKLLFILLLFISFISNSQNEFYNLTLKEIDNSSSSLSVSFFNPKSNFNVFFATILIVENPELNPCADITSNAELNKLILDLLKKHNVLNKIYIEGENGIIDLESEELVDLEKNSLIVDLYYDSDKTMGTVYLGIKKKSHAKNFISNLIEKIGYKDCLRKLKRKI
ncbi:hypothetical protein ACOSP6_00450 [Tenacibaculum sp. MEBiC06402]|uniref:hypothetical protein n=1 Tax=unclassified Tenacibaculum TaxID=2635139 RepID=UPI003B9B780C